MPAPPEVAIATPGPRPPLPGRAAYHDLLVAGVDPPSARARVAAGVALAVAEATGVELPALALLSRWGAPASLTLEAAPASPGLVGSVHEALLDSSGRRSGGAFYTPAATAGVVVGWALESPARARPVVCDPAVGGGAFLLAAADALAATGWPRDEVVSECLMGADVDPVAMAVSEAALALWCRGAALPRLIEGDALSLTPGDWPSQPDVVVGNPPFLNQLARATARGRDDVVALRRRLGGSVTAYADTAVLFLVMGARLVRPGGTVALVLPESFLATRDARAARSAVLSEAGLEVLWLPSVPIFDDTPVRVCVPVLRRRAGGGGRVRLFKGMPPRLTAEVEVESLVDAPTWSHLLATGSGVPEVGCGGEGTLGEWCEVSADFRQHYYGVAPFMVDDVAGELDDRHFPPLVTVGLIDPAACRWGQRPTRHHRNRWERPRVDLARLDAGTELGSWARARLVPKVVVATQTRVIEAAVDVYGTWLPSTPLISVVAPPARLWHLAAALLSPPVTALALRRWGGAALSAAGLKLGASQVRSLPSPRPGQDWDEAAAAVRGASEAREEGERRRWLVEAAWASSRAYGVEDRRVVDWWEARLARPSGR